MWFKNLTLYRFADSGMILPTGLSEYLDTKAFTGCEPSQMESTGWIPPAGVGLAHEVSGCVMLCQQIESKLLPSSVINDYLGERIARADGPVSRRERVAMREEIIADLLPHAFNVRKRVHGYIDLDGGWLVVDSASTYRADEFCTLLRDTLGSLPVAPPKMEFRPLSVLTEWVANGPPDGFTIADDCDLYGLHPEASSVKCRHQDLSATEVRTHLAAGKCVTSLALVWRDRLSFTLTSDLDVRKLRFLDVVQDQAAEVETDDDVQRFDADFAIMAGEVRDLLADLSMVFGVD